MSSTNVSPNPEITTITFPSLAALRVAHNELLKQHRQVQDEDLSEQLRGKIEAFIHQGKATGALLDSEDDRWAAQSLLDYWTSVLSRSGYKPPEATLADFDLSLAPKLDDNLCPYRGLEAFREEDRKLFHGRQKLLEYLLQKLQESRLLAVVGSSGSGKSSVVLGGLIPSLKAGTEKLPESKNWHYYGSIVPGSNPLENLARLFCPECDEESGSIEQKAQKFIQNSGYLTKLLNHTDNQPSVLVIDQFEETLQLCLDQEKRDAFINNILGVIQSPGVPHRIILTMRVDFLKDFTHMEKFYPELNKATFFLTPLDASELREAIEKPAKLIGLKFEERLVDKLIKDVLGEEAALPLLQFTLLKLWDHRERNRITQESYKRLGGGRLALSKSADEFYDNNLIPEDQVTCKRIFLKMVQPTKGEEFTSRRIRVQELYRAGEASDRVERVLEKLIEARLVKITQGYSSNDDQDAQVEVAHEALIRNWPRLVGWLEDERVNLRDRLQLTAKAKEWDTKGRIEGALLRGKLLEEVKQTEDLTDLEKEFIRVSKNYERRNRFSRRILFSFGFLGFIAAIFYMTLTGWIVSERTKHLREDLEKVEKQLDNKKQELNTKEQELNTKTQKLNTTTQELNTTTQELNTKEQELNTKTQKLNTTTQELKTTTAQLDTTIPLLKENQEKLEKTNNIIEQAQKYQKDNTRQITDTLDLYIIDPLSVDLNNNRTISREQMEIMRQKAFEIRAIVEEGNVLAKAYERDGFQALVDRNLKQAKDYFGKAYKAGPTYHSVDEIFHKVLTDDIIKEYESPNTSDSRKQQIIKEIYQKIVTDYYPRAPQKQLEEMKKHLGLN